jgi:hypothetical protein
MSVYPPEAESLLNPDEVRRRRVGGHTLDVVLRHLHTQAGLRSSVAWRGALDLHEEERRRLVLFRAKFSAYESGANAELDARGPRASSCADMRSR